MKSKVIENAAKVANQKLKEKNIKILTNHREKVFLFFLKNYSDPSEVFCIPGNLLSDEQYLIVAAAQNNLSEQTIDSLDEIHFEWCVELWFTTRHVRYDIDVDYESHGCLIDQSIPYDPCESYVFIKLSN